MDFDIKNIKSWANRDTVKIGDKGYFFDDIHSMKDKKDCTAFSISGILDNRADCFCIKDRIGISSFNFFLPLEAIKEDKPKKKYRPFKNLYEFYKFLSYDNFTEEEFTQNMLLGEVFTYREKKAPRYAHTTVITKINFDLADDPCEPNIEGRNLEMWFDRFEIRNDDLEWQPFGVKDEQ